MKERGIIIDIGDNVQVMLLAYWRCWLGHKWVYDARITKRVCTRCNKHQFYQLVDIGRSKTWVWLKPQP